MGLDQHTPPFPLERRRSAGADHDLTGTPPPPAARSLGLLVFEGNALHAIVPLGIACVTVGRDPASSIRLRDKAVSRRHCTLLLLGNNVLLTDAGSTNGTYRFGRRIDSVLLGEGDEVTIGLVLIKLVDLGTAPWTSVEDPFSRLYIDAPSGLLNRRGFRLRVDACRSVLPPGTALGLMLIGVNGFRSQGAGHRGVGAVVSADLAAHLGKSMADTLPAHAYGARIGADQFAVVVFGADAQQLRALVERLRAEFNRFRTRLFDHRLRPTFDVGIASGQIEAEGLRPMFCLADDALDRARAEGPGASVYLTRN